MNAITYLILSSFFHATWNSFLKTRPQKNLFLFKALLIAIFFGWSLSFIFDPWANYASWPWTAMIFSGLTEGIYFVTLTLALKDAPLAMAYSITRTTAMLLSWAFTFCFMNEVINMQEFPGIGFIFVGLILPVIFGQTKKVASGQNHSYFWSYACGASVVAYNTFYSIALNQGAAPLACLAISLTIGAPFLLLTYEKGIKEGIRNLKFKTLPWYEWRNIILLGCLITASFFCYLTGLIGIGPSLAITIRNLSIGFALIYSRLLGEKLKTSEIISLVFIIVGVLLLSTH